MTLRIFVADDCPLVLKSLRSLLGCEGFDIVGEAADGHAAVKEVDTFRPDVAILDLSMPGKSGIDAAREIRDRCPGVRTILLTAYDAGHLVTAALRAGVRGFVVKTEAADHLAQAIRAVHQDETYLSPSASRALLEYDLPKVPAGAAPPRAAVAPDAAPCILPRSSVFFRRAPPGFTD